MFRVVSLMKTGNSDPQQYTLVMKDLENTQKGYLGRTETGTEETIREALRKGGMPESEIDVAFARAYESEVLRLRIRSGVLTS
jgi:hypothetical protein